MTSQLGRLLAGLGDTLREDRLPLDHVRAAGSGVLPTLTYTCLGHLCDMSQINSNLYMSYAGAAYHSSLTVCVLVIGTDLC